eukprot:4730332-Pyramimonas_sp.AAC.1
MLHGLNLQSSLPPRSRRQRMKLHVLPRHRHQQPLRAEVRKQKFPLQHRTRVPQVPRAFPCDEDPEFAFAMEDENYPLGPAFENLFRRVTLPPAPGRRQRQPTPLYPQKGDQENADKPFRARLVQ